MSAAEHPTAETLRVASALGNPFVYLCPRRKRTFSDARDKLLASLDAQDGDAWILLDGALPPTMLARFRENAVECHTLFPDDTEPALLELAPLLIRPASRLALLEAWREFWGRGIGCIVLSNATAGDLLRQLRSALYVEVDGGEICVFRYFDPRVLQKFEQILDEQQIADLMGTEIACFLFEEPDGALGVLAHPGEKEEGKTCFA